MNMFLLEEKSSVAQMTITFMPQFIGTHIMRNIVDTIGQTGSICISNRLPTNFAHIISFPPELKIDVVQSICWSNKPFSLVITVERIFALIPGA
jgi:hypothetical protein